MSVERLIQDAVLRVGEVCAVDGRRIYVLVDRDKNLSDMFLDGDILRNIAVNSYIEIRKGFLSIIGRVEGEKIEEDASRTDSRSLQVVNRSKRILTIALSGYIDESGVFNGGTKELPLIGNEAYIVTRKKIHVVHNLVRSSSVPTVCIADIFNDNISVDFPIDGLFNSHIAIFGNTGSGKSNTLAFLYQELVRTLTARNAAAFRANAHFVLFDFNGEYARQACITEHKKVYRLSTQNQAGDRLPLDEQSILDLEILSILSDATEKTQKPFLRRALRLFRHVNDAQDGDPSGFLRNILRKRIKDWILMSDKIRAYLILDYFREILPEDSSDPTAALDADIEWHNTTSQYKSRSGGYYFGSQPELVEGTSIYQRVTALAYEGSVLDKLIIFLYIQLIDDILSNRAQNEHVAPVINRLRAKKGDIDKIFDLSGANSFWFKNFVVVDLDNVNLNMKKTIPLLLSKHLYAEQKKLNFERSLTIIIDEAHNILSTESFREAESWKDYRLETFEEIIKEGRKFGVFVTIASQRPYDIAHTIVSQAHNYFIHRLINDKDLQSIASTVSYIDRVTEESIPTLPTGTCIFSGVASQMPMKICIRPLQPQARPRSGTLAFGEIIPGGSAS
jgi:DNA helicase HerA-like ATPase